MWPSAPHLVCATVSTLKSKDFVNWFRHGVIARGHLTEICEDIEREPVVTHFQLS